jgi:alanine racemase
MVRVGLGLYGYLPCGANAETGISTEVENGLRLKKGMDVFAKVVAKRKYVFGGVGYGPEYNGKDIGILSVCRVGYADGFLRDRENGINGYKDNANHLCMDACIRFGNLDRGAWLPILTDAKQTAEKTGTIVYEVLCAATRRAELIYEE